MIKWIRNLLFPPTYLVVVDGRSIPVKEREVRLNLDSAEKKYFAAQKIPLAEAAYYCARIAKCRKILEQIEAQKGKAEQPDPKAFLDAYYYDLPPWQAGKATAVNRCPLLQPGRKRWKPNE